MKLKLILTGDMSTTSVINADTGEPIGGIQELTVHYDSGKPFPTVTMKVAMIPSMTNINTHSIIEEEFVNKNALNLK